MPSTLEKARKHIAKKRNGHDLALHEFSRDSKRLHKASIRDQRLGKLHASKNKKEQPMIDRASYFQKAIQEKGSEPLDLAAVQELISKFVHQYDEEYAEVKKTRRAGRPANAKEDLLKLKISNLEEEYKIGFYLPDLTNSSNVTLLDRWEGSWAYLTSVAWVKITSDGNVRTSSFPPRV
ncbi:translation machinery-associated protein 16 [Colletotrichum phormii]|uniref:Translation machinery-associated protein 16 n=1 Tax=Colletotrichum phormii TaxID=359342 RepID=A0AAI9ZV99_9PEZI|nr:translation machinery-associated protein 16 [Colletotrichum phormii]KAK1638821.1 translation machinery-associated protein 16 [Colletotrichum phormii]